MMYISDKKTFEKINTNKDKDNTVKNTNNNKNNTTNNKSTNDNDTLLVGIHQLQVEKSAEKTFQTAFSSNIVQVFLWNNHHYLKKAKMQDIYNNLINGFKGACQVKQLSDSKHPASKLFVIHADYLIQLVSNTESVKKESVKTNSIEDYQVMNTIAYNLQKFIHSYKDTDANKTHSYKADTTDKTHSYKNTSTHNKTPSSNKKPSTQVAINVHLPAKLYKDKKLMEEFLKMVSKYTADNVLILFENVSKTDFSDYLISYTQAKYHLSKMQPSFKKNMGMTLDTAHVIGSGFTLQDVETIFTTVKKENMLKTDIRDEVRLIHMNGNEKKKSSKQDKHLSIFDKRDNVFEGDDDKIKSFVEYVKTNFKKCYGFILERNDLTFDETEQEKLEKIISTV